MSGVLIDFFDLSIDAMCIVNRKAVLIQFNLAFSKITDIDSDQLEKKSLIDLLYESDQERFRQYLDETLQSKNPETIYIKLATSDDADFRVRGCFVQNTDLIALTLIKLPESRYKNTRNNLRNKDQLLDLFFEQSLDGFFFMMLDEPVDWASSKNNPAIIDRIFANQRITMVNDAMLLQYRASREEFMGITPLELFGDDIEAGKKAMIELFTHGHTHLETNETRYDGTSMWVEGDYICLYDEQGRITGHFGIQRDITAKKRSETELQITKDLLNSIFNEMEDVVYSFHPDEKESLFITPSTEKFYGEPQKLFIEDSRRWEKYIHPDDRHVADEIYKEVEKKGFYEKEYRIIAVDGTLKWVRDRGRTVYNESGQMIRIDGVITDITERKKLESDLRQMATTDALTGLYNRRYFMTELARQYDRVKRYNEIASIILVDLDYFKDINDTYGHSAGDDVLRLFATTLKEMRISDTCARIGGEEFAILLPQTSSQQSYLVAERFREKIQKQTVEAGSREIKFTISIGISEIYQSDDSQEASLRRADKALYRAKGEGRNRVSVHSL